MAIIPLLPAPPAPPLLCPVNPVYLSPEPQPRGFEVGDSVHIGNHRRGQITQRMASGLYRVVLDMPGCTVATLKVPFYLTHDYLLAAMPREIRKAA